MPPLVVAMLAGFGLGTVVFLGGIAAIGLFRRW